MHRVCCSVKAMIELQELTGVRPGEVCGLKAEMIDRSGPVWRCELAKHKTAHRGKRRVLFFGAKAQAILAPFLLKRAPGKYLFQPSDAWGELMSKKESEDGGRRENQKPNKKLSDRCVQPCYNKDSYDHGTGRSRLSQPHHAHG